MSIVLVQPLHSRLLSSTALSTQHGFWSKIIGIAASIIIPFVAPAFAGPMMVSLGIANSVRMISPIVMAIGSGILGGAFSAGIASLTGGDPLRGGIFGALGSAYTGYKYEPPAGGGKAGLSVVGAGSGADPTQMTDPGYAAQIPVETTALAAPPSNVVFDEFNQSWDLPGGGTPSDGFKTLNAGMGGTPAGDVPVGGLSGSNAVPPAAGAQTAGVTPPPTEDPGFLQKLMKSEAVGAAGSKLLTNLATSLTVGAEPDLTPYEQSLLEERDRARAFESEQLNEKKKVSDRYVQLAANINPDYYAQRARTEGLNTLTRAQAGGLRGINPNRPGARQAQMARNALQKSRLSNYGRGRQAAEASRLQLMQAAQATAPTGTNRVTGITRDLAAYDKQYTSRLAAANQEASNVWQPIVNEIFGTVDEEKLKKKKVGVV